MRICKVCTEKHSLFMSGKPDLVDTCDWCNMYRPCYVIADFKEDLTMTDKKIVIRHESLNEQSARSAALDLFKQCPIPDEDVLSYLPIYIKRQDYTRMLFAHDIYQKILKVPGVILDFGCRWGTNMVMFTNLRGILEPFNYQRKIIGFDTFTGFKKPVEQDGKNIEEGMYAVSGGYETYLEALLDYHELECPVSHLKKHEVVKGDVVETLPKYLEEHPETVVSLAYFDMNEYEPTMFALNEIMKYMLRGSVIVLDQPVSQDYPGETIAARERRILTNFTFRRSPYSCQQAYMVLD